MDSTTVCYLIKRVMTRPHTLECTQQVPVSGACILIFVSTYTLVAHGKSLQ